MFPFPTMTPEDQKHMDYEMKCDLHHAIEKSDLEGMKKALRGCSDSVAHSSNPFGDSSTALSHAGYSKDLTCFRLMLSHPKVDVNRAPQGITVLCEFVRDPAQRSLLLRDHRVILGLAPETKTTPLRKAAMGNLENVKALMADGRPLDEDYVPPGAYEESAIELAKNPSDWETRGVVALLEEYKANPIAVRRRLRRDLGVDEQDAGGLYATVVLLCDGLLTLPANDQEDLEKKTQAIRFFRIACRLPLELQALLCLRVYDCPKDTISLKVSETEFRWLLERLGMEDHWQGDVDPYYLYP